MVEPVDTIHTAAGQVYTVPRLPSGYAYRSLVVELCRNSARYQ